MKAIQKSTGKIIDVELSQYKPDHDGEIYYDTKSMRLIHAYGLDFNIPKENQSVTIEGWVARDKEQFLYLFDEEPTRIYNESWGSLSDCLRIYPEYFPDLKWEDEPIKVKITIEEV